MGAFDLRDLTVPVIVAPMAGGPSTPSWPPQEPTPAASGSSPGAT